MVVAIETNKNPVLKKTHNFENQKYTALSLRNSI